MMTTMMIVVAIFSQHKAEGWASRVDARPGTQPSAARGTPPRSGVLAEGQHQNEGHGVALALALALVRLALALVRLALVRLALALAHDRRLHVVQLIQYRARAVESKQNAYGRVIIIDI